MLYNDIFPGFLSYISENKTWDNVPVLGTN